MDETERTKLKDWLKPWIIELGGGKSAAGSSGYAPSPHSLDSIHHGSSPLAKSQAPWALAADGTVTLTGNLPVADGVTIDGIDISAHAADANAHHALVTAGDTSISVTGQAVRVNLATGSGLTVNSGLKVDTGVNFNWSGFHTFNAGLRVAAGQYLSFGSDVYLSRTAANVLGLDTGDAFQSTNYVAGLSGWKIDEAGNAEFESGRFRGAIRASVFEKSIVSAFAGSLIVSKSAAKLNANFAVDNGTPPFTNTAHLVVEDPPGGGWLFETNDIIRIKAAHATGVGDTWGVVTRTATQNEYTVSIQYGTVNITYPAGTAVVDYGVSGQGTFAVSADGTFGASTAWTLESHAGAPWTTRTIQVYAGTDGKLYAGGGAVILDANGFTIERTNSYQDIRAYKFAASGTVVGGLCDFEDTGDSTNTLQVSTPQLAATNTKIRLLAQAPLNYTARVRLFPSVNGRSTTYMDLTSTDTGSAYTFEVTINDGGLNVGGVSGAAPGEVKCSGAVTATGAITSGGTNVLTATNSVHGLGSAHVLGALAGAGRYVQFASGSATVAAGNWVDITVSWPSAFSALSLAVACAVGSSNCYGYLKASSASGATFTIYNATGGQLTLYANFLGFGT